MKKVLFTAALFSVCTFVMAQEATTATPTPASAPSEFKPTAGANNLELNFIPLSGTPIKLTYIRYRRFLTATTAVRVGVGLSISSTSVDSIFTTTSGGKVISKSKTSKTGWNIKPGIEKHFAGTNRLSPYFGAELDLAGQSSKDVTPVGLTTTDAVIIVTSRNKAKGGFFRVGAGVLAGFDCYITKHLYLGSEFGFGLQLVKYSDLRTEVSTGGPAIVDVNQGSEFNLGPNFNSSIRLGWIF